MEKDVVWEGDSLAKMRGFPSDVKINIGGDLRRIQIGVPPLDSRPMKSIDSGVYELRDQDSSGWYRVIYYMKIKNKIHVLHCFEKKSAKTPQKDLNTATTRLKNLLDRLKEEKE